ncbi:hypothetical protein L9F63_022776, partial [Diploptera punctata]
SVPSTSTSYRPTGEGKVNKVEEDTEQISIPEVPLHQSWNFQSSKFKSSDAYLLLKEISPHIYEPSLSNVDAEEKLHHPYTFSRTHGGTITPHEASVKVFHPHLGKLLKHPFFKQLDSKLIIEDKKRYPPTETQHVSQMSPTWISNAVLWYRPRGRNDLDVHRKTFRPYLFDTKQIVWEGLCVLRTQLKWLEAHKRNFHDDVLNKLDYDVFTEACKLYTGSDNIMSAKKWYENEQSVEIRRTLGLLTALAEVSNHGAKYMS